MPLRYTPIDPVRTDSRSTIAVPVRPLHVLKLPPDKPECIAPRRLTKLAFRYPQPDAVVEGFFCRITKGNAIFFWLLRYYDFDCRKWLTIINSTQLNSTQFIDVWQLWSWIKQTQRTHNKTQSYTHLQGWMNEWMNEWMRMLMFNVQPKNRQKVSFVYCTKKN